MKMKKSRTFHQLSAVIGLYHSGSLDRYHPLFGEIQRYDDLLKEQKETSEDVEYTERINRNGDYDEELLDLYEVQEELKDLVAKQWMWLMNNFVLDVYLHQYQPTEKK